MTSELHVRAVPPGPSRLPPSSLVQHLLRTQPQQRTLRWGGLAWTVDNPQECSRVFVSLSSEGDSRSSTSNSSSNTAEELSEPSFAFRLRRAVERARRVVLRGPRGEHEEAVRAVRRAARSAGKRVIHVDPEALVGDVSACDARLGETFRFARETTGVIVMEDLDMVFAKDMTWSGDEDVHVVAGFTRHLLVELVFLLHEFPDVGFVGVVSTDLARIHPAVMDHMDELLRMPMYTLKDLEEYWRRAFPQASSQLLDLASTCAGFTSRDLRFVRGSTLEATQRACTDHARFHLDMKSQHFTVVPPPRENHGKPKGWNSVGGHQAAKHALEEAVVWPRTKRTELQAFDVAPPRGVLLHGPPGTGKTMLVRATAQEAGVNLLSVSIADVVRGEVGESERIVHEVFAAARACSPCVLFFDEAQAVFCKRGTGGPVSAKIVAQLTAELDELQAVGDTGVVVLAATNVLDEMDPALLRVGRFETVVFVGPCTSVDEMVDILVRSVASASAEHGVSCAGCTVGDVYRPVCEALLGAASSGSAPVVGADVASLGDRAVLEAVLDGCEEVGRQHFEAALRDVRG